MNIKDPERKRFDFPLSPGKKWSFQYPNPDLVTGNTLFTQPRFRDAEVEVIGPVSQPLETSAGKFKVVEIRRTDSAYRDRYDLKYFYSPETKSVVKLTGLIIDSGEPIGHYEMELIKYSLH